MKLKKFLATVMAVALAVSPMTVSANGEVTAPGSTEFDVEGGATYVDTTKYKVTLPTSQSLNFTLDPSGIFGYVQAHPGATDFTEQDITDGGYAGKIVGVGAHNIVNKSSVPVAVTCDYKLSTTASDVSFSTSTSLTPATISGNQINLTVVGGTATVSGNAVTGFNEAPSGFKKGIGTDSTEIMVLLDKTDYQYTVNNGTFDYVQNPNGRTQETSAALSVGGCISKDHDWSELTGENGKKVKLSCVFSFKGVKDSSGATVTDSFVTANADQIEFLDGSSSGLTGTYDKSNAGPFSMPLNGFNVRSVRITSKPGTASMSTVINTTTHYTVKDDTFYLKTAWASGLAVGNWTFELSDGTTTKTLTLTVTD